MGPDSRGALLIALVEDEGTLNYVDLEGVRPPIPLVRAWGRPHFDPSGPYALVNSGDNFVRVPLDGRGPQEILHEANAFPVLFGPSHIVFGTFDLEVYSLPYEGGEPTLLGEHGTGNRAR